MVSSNKQSREARETRERLRGYNARQTLHQEQKRRRVRDNWIAGVVVVVIIVLSVGAQLFYFNGGPGTAAPATTAPATTDAASGQNTGDVPAASLSENRTWTGDMTINGVDLGISLDGAAAPQAVASFVTLAQSGFFNTLTCHRLTTGEGFKVLQCGDPSGDGSGGPGYSFGPVENAPSDNIYKEGVIAMARQSDNAYSMGSQFFIVYGDTTIPADTAGGYTVFGTITSGLDSLKTAVTDQGTADGSADGKPKVTTVISSVTVQ